LSVDEFLKIHKPSPEALERARAEGIDLLVLKETNPNEYKMRSAQEVLQTSSVLADIASQVFFAAFPHHELFRHGDSRWLSFPELSSKELQRWDDALARLVLHPKYAKNYLYYHVINDKHGEERHLDFPVNPKDWQGQINVLIGPFATQSEAEAWAEAIDQQFMVDIVPYLQGWFCDIFLVEL
jgi:hypothetical protein